MGYAAERQSAYNDIKAAGGPVSITRTVPGAYDPVADTRTGDGEVTEAGVALQVDPNRTRYADGALVSLTEATLLIAAQGFTREPLEGDRVTWRGAVWEVVGGNVLAPDGGDPILFRVTVAR